MCVLNGFSHFWLCVALWTVALQTPLFVGFPRQEYRSRLPFPSLQDLPDSGMKPGSLALQVDSRLSLNIPWSPPNDCVNPNPCHMLSKLCLLCFPVYASVWPAGSRQKLCEASWPLVLCHLQYEVLSMCVLCELCITNDFLFAWAQVSTVLSWPLLVASCLFLHSCPIKSVNCIIAGCQPITDSVSFLFKNLWRLFITCKVKKVSVELDLDTI